MTTTRKRKVSVSLDDDLVADLEASGEALSTQVNDALRLEVARRRRRRALEEMLAGMDADHGPVDERLVQKYVDMIG